MQSFSTYQEPQKKEFNTANALSETSKPSPNLSADLSTDLTDDDFDFYKAREGASKMQSDFLGWQSAQTKEDKDGTESEKEYDQWYSNETTYLTKNMNDNQRTYFERMAKNQDSVQRPWAQNYQKEQRKSYGINTQNSVLEANKTALAANLHDDNFVSDSFAQIIGASNELARLQGLGDKERSELRVKNVNDSIKSALQGRIDAEDLEDATKLYRRNGHYLTTANQEEIKNNIRGLHSRMQNRKTIDDVSGKLLQMDEDMAAMHLGDVNWLSSMNISDDMLGELKEVNTVQRQKILRENNKSKDAQEFTWFDKVVTESLKDPIAGLRIVQERKDIEPELRNSILDAIQNGRINTNDDAATIFALQDRILGDDPDIENGEFAREIGKGNLRIDSFKSLAEMQKNLNKGEKNLVRNALHILDSSFDSTEDYRQNPNRLAARNIYLKSLTKAIANNDTAQLVQLTNKEHVQSVGQSFSAGNVFSKPISNAQNNQQSGNFLQKMFNGLQNTFGSSVAHAGDTSINHNAKPHDAITKPVQEVESHEIASQPTNTVMQEQYGDVWKSMQEDSYPKYTKEAFDMVEKARPDIIAASNVTGISAKAIAGAIVDEKSSQHARWLIGDWLDAFQDGIVSKGASYDALGANMDNPDYDAWLLDPNNPKHDVGPGNFGQRTARPLFEKYILGKDIHRDYGRELTQEEKNLRHSMQHFLSEHVGDNATEQEKWKAFIDNMAQTTEGTAWIAAAEMLHGKEQLERDGALDGLSELEIAAVLVTWYKQGDRYLKRYLDNRKNGNVGAIRPGEGVNLFFYPKQFEKY